jgi:metal-responsive CopG/Arc/MetJ family transcriptional regulator
MEMCMAITIQMTFDEPLLKTLDRTVKQMKTTRSALIRESVRLYLKTLRVREMEASHRAGYLKHPVKRGEFDVWDHEQDWGD